MIVMPSSAAGWIWHSLARETGRIGHLYSPNDQRGPWPWMPYAIDNGCFGMWDSDNNTFDEARWLSNVEGDWRRLLFWCESTEQKPMWSIVPDRPGDWAETARKWGVYASSIPFPLAVAVQDGATPEAVRALSPAPVVVCVGGSTDWKWSTAEMWLKEFPRVHVLRCNSPERLHWLEALGCESADGTGWNRGDRHIRTRALEEWARLNAKPTTLPLWKFASRTRSKTQMEFA